VRAGLEPLSSALGDAADATSSVEYLLALAAVQALARRVVSFWGEFDLLLTPTLALPPVPVDWHAEVTDPWEQFARNARFTPFTPLVNVTGQPAASLPLHWSADGLPIGVQLIGRPADEATILRVSAQLEAARPWRDRRPEVFVRSAEATRSA
jgi:amidase